MSPSPCPSCGRALEAGPCPDCAKGASRSPSLPFALVMVAGGTFIMGGVAVIAARAIPPEPVERASSNEAGAAIRLTAIHRAEQRFLETDADHDGTRDLGSLEELARAELIEVGLTTGPRSGYVFACKAGADAAGRPRFAATATPVSPGADRYLGIDDAGVRFASPTTPFQIDEGRLVRPADAAPLEHDRG